MVNIVWHWYLCRFKAATAPPPCQQYKTKKRCYLFKWPELTDSGPQKVAKVRHETQIHILNLLITSLELKMPNLALYLLGYEVKKPVSSTTLQDPGQNTACLYGTCNITNAWHWILFTDWVLNRCIGMSTKLPACHFESATKRHWEEIRTCTHTTGTSPGWALLPGKIQLMSWSCYC